MRKTLLLGAVTAFLIAACGDGPGKIIGIDETGVVTGLAYVDRDGDGVRGPSDGVATGVAAALVLEATGDTVARATTRTDGTFIMTQVPVGRYRLVANRGTLPDTLDVLRVDSAQVTLAARDTAIRLIRVGYPRSTVAGLATTPVGRRVTVEGLALNSWTTFADSTLHVADATGAIRAIRVPASAIQAGDSVSLLATVGSAAGRTVLVDVVARVLVAARGLPPADSLPTTTVAGADGGRLANAQARIAGAIIRDTSVVAGDLVLGVDDGSGRMEVVLDRHIAFNAGPWVPGGTFAGTGVLVPALTGGTWQLKPRDRNEAEVTFPSTPIAEARTLEDGRQVVLQGLALNAWTTFGDSTVHMMDATGTIRAVRVVPTAVFAAGDSVRMVGIMGTRNGQRVLTAATASRIRAGVGLPEPDSLSSAIAASAQGGARDAALVRAAGTIIGSQSLSNGDLLLSIDDGSGRLDVRLGGNISFAGVGPLTPGAILNATGVLVPVAAAGPWQLRPRAAADVRGTHPTVTVAEARALPVGRTVQVVGIALSGWATFGDQTLHLRDGTGSIRIVQLPSAAIFAGDSVRILGTVAVRNGQPVLTGSSSSVLLAGVGTGAPDSVSTKTAAEAAGGSRDAGQVAVSGSVSAVVVEPGTSDILLTVSDGSGSLVVRLDRDVGFLPGTYSADDVIRARGVLVPDEAGSAWELKPRTLTEVAKTNGGG
jgi:uncharacterized protein YdeI (BOF family)